MKTHSLEGKQKETKTDKRTDIQGKVRKKRGQDIRNTGNWNAQPRRIQMTLGIC